MGLPVQHQSLGGAPFGEFARRHGDVSFTVRYSRPGNQAPGKDDPSVVAKALRGGGNETVLAGAARADDEDQRTASAHGTQANDCRRPMIAKRSLPEIQSMTATAARISSTMEATWSKS